MSSFPVILPSGTIAVYGIGTNNVLPSGVTIESNWRQGTVYNIWDGGATYIYGGDVVYWKDGDQMCRITTSENIIYTVIPARLVTIDGGSPP